MLHGFFLRPARAVDGADIGHTHALAFGRTGEADLVEALAAGPGGVSLVATNGAAVVGHVLFSPVTVESPTGNHAALSLAPLGVRPSYQRRGIGAGLVRAGLAACCALPYRQVFVLGDPRYYARFGFVAAATHGIRCEFPAPSAAFQVLVLAAGTLPGAGVVRYPPPFHRLEKPG